MTDEISIQQQQGNYALPGAVLGAGVGAGAGVAAAHYKNWGYTQKPTEEQIKKLFEQEPDSFNGKIDRTKDDVKAYYEAAKTEVQKVKDAGPNYDKALEEVKAQTKTEEVPLSEDLKTKKANAETAYTNALEAEKKVLSENKVINNEFKFPTADEVKNLGDKVSIAEINEYNTRLNNYKTALNNAKVNADRTALENFKTNVMYHVYDIDRVSHKPKSALLPGFTHKMAMNRMINNLDRDINALIPEISDPRRIQHELKLAGKDYKPGSKNYKKFVNQLNEQIRNDRAALREQILGERIQVDVVNPKTNKVTGKRITYKNIESFIKGEENTFNRQVKLEKKLPKGVTYASLDTVENYKKQLDKLQKNKGITIAAKEAREKQLNKMIELATEKENIQKVKDGRMNRFFGRISYTNKLEEKINKAIQNDSQVQSALQRLKNFAEKNEAIKGIAFSTVEETMTEEQILTKAKEAIKDTKAATDLAAVEKEIADFRAANPSKKIELTAEDIAKAMKDKGFEGSKEEYIKSVQEKSTETLKKLAEKAKVANKTWTGVIGAAGLAAVGGLIGMAMKKDQA